MHGQVHISVTYFVACGSYFRTLICCKLYVSCSGVSFTKKKQSRRRFFSHTFWLKLRNNSRNSVYVWLPRIIVFHPAIHSICIQVFTEDDWKQWQPGLKTCYNSMVFIILRVINQCRLLDWLLVVRTVPVDIFVTILFMCMLSLQPPEQKERWTVWQIRWPKISLMRV